MPGCGVIEGEPVRSILALPHALWQMVKTSLAHRAFQSLGSFAILLIIGGSIFYWKVEGWSYMDSLYFAVATLATVGFGDISPQTDIGKLFTVAYLLLGLGVIASFISSLSATEMRVLKHEHDRMRSNRPRSERHAGDDPPAPS